MKLKLLLDESHIILKPIGSYEKGIKNLLIGQGWRFSARTGHFYRGRIDMREQYKKTLINLGLEIEDKT
jgi:hypothetical protein